MKTLRAHGFNQRPRFEQVVGYLERNEPLPLDQPDRKATSFVTSHFYLDVASFMLLADRTSCTAASSLPCWGRKSVFSSTQPVPRARP